MRSEAHMKLMDDQMFFRSPEDLRVAWQAIPGDVDILLTHTPPKYVLDGAANYGCGELTQRVASLPSLRIHAFGHIHQDYGYMSVGGAELLARAQRSCLHRTEEGQKENEEGEENGRKKNEGKEQKDEWEKEGRSNWDPLFINAALDDSEAPIVVDIYAPAAASTLKQSIH